MTSAITVTITNRIACQDVIERRDQAPGVPAPRRGLSRTREGSPCASSPPTDTSSRPGPTRSFRALGRATVPSHEIIEVGAIAPRELGGGAHVAARSLEDHVEVRALER